MAIYMITYDLHRERNYDRVYELMDEWSAERILESVWLAQLLGPAEVVRDIVRYSLDGDDSVAVIELDPAAEWATFRCENRGINWLKTHIPFRV